MSYLNVAAQLCYKQVVPKIVDPEQRRRELGEAVLRVIHRDGIPGASLRNVAKEAGMSMGALRHYFDSQAEMLTFSLKLIGEHIRERLSRIGLATNPRRLAEQVIGEILPIDDRRRVEAQVWLAFIAASLTDPKLRPYSDDVHDSLRSLVEQVVRHLSDAGALRPDLTLDVEVLRLHALADGLALHAITRPAVIDEARLTLILKRHLEDICAPPARETGRDGAPVLRFSSAHARDNC